MQQLAQDAMLTFFYFTFLYNLWYKQLGLDLIIACYISYLGKIIKATAYNASYKCNNYMHTYH